MHSPTQTQDAPAHGLLTPFSDEDHLLPSTRWRFRRCTVITLIIAATLFPAPSAFPQSSDDKKAAPAQTHQDPAVKEKPPPPTPVVILEGQVTDSIGAGKKGISISVRLKGTKDQPGEQIAQTQTDEFGDFKVSAPAPIHGDVIVTMTLPMYATITHELHLGDAKNIPFLAEELRGKLVVIGRVTDALTKEPVEKANVKLDAAYHETFAETDEQGHFTIKGIAPGSGVLIVEKKGYGREKREVRRLEDFGEILISLKPERIIHLTIIDETGLPISGTTVESYDQPRDDFRTLVTSDEGKTTISGVHFDARRLELRLTHDEYVSSEEFSYEILPPIDATESSHKLTMPRAGFLTGSVIDAATGAALGGARIMTGAEYIDSSPRDWADFEGNYRIIGIRPGKCVVTVHLNGYSPQLAIVDIKAKETTELNIKLSAPKTLKGFVRSEDGHPVPGVYLRTGRWRGYTTLGLRAITDHEGRFAIENAPADEFEVLVSAKYAEHSFTVTSGEKSVELSIPDPPTGSGLGIAAGVKVGDKTPDLTLTTIDGTTIKTSAWKGKVVVVDFWATWCGPCIAELPHLITTYDKLKSNKDFLLVGVSLDSDEKAVRRFIKDRKIKWTQVYGPSAQSAADTFGVSGIPALFIIGRNGKIETTATRGQDLVETVQRILKRDESS